MAYWIDPVNGSDLNPGTSFGSAKQSWKGGIDAAVAAGDPIVNLVNSGPSTVPSAATITVTGRIGTNYSNPGLLIRGVSDAAATPALAEVRFQDNNSAQSLLTVSNNSAYIVIQGLLVNWSVNATAATAKAVITRTSTTAQNIRLEYCHFKGKSTVGGIICRDNTINSAKPGGEMRYNYIVGTHISVIKMLCDPTGTSEFHNNVVLVTAGGGSAQTIMDCSSADGPVTDHRFYHNTIVVRSGATASILLPWLSADTTGPSSGTSIKQCHSNIYANYLAGASDVYRFVEGPGGTPSSANYVRTFGYNLFYLPGGKAFSGPGPYWRPWDPDDSDVPEGTSYWLGDQVASADPFNAPLDAWTWENVNNSGYDLQLDGDFRVTVESGFRAAGMDGSIPGAIEDGFVTPSPPPVWNDVPVGPENPGFSFPAPDGITAALRLRRNTYMEAAYRVDGLLESLTHVNHGMTEVVAGAANADMAVPAGSRLFMAETDSGIIVQLNGQTFTLRAGGCVALAGANLTTFKISNPSAVKSAIIRFMGAQ